MSAITFYQYPGAVESQAYGSGSYTDVDDPWDGHDGWATKYGLLAANNGVTYRQAFASFGLTAPQTGLSINWIRVHAWFALGRAGGAWVAEPIVICGVRPASSATYYDSSQRTIVDTGGRATASGSYAVTTLPTYNFNTQLWGLGSTGFAHVYWQFDGNPVGGAWTVPDLQSFLISIWADHAKGSPGVGTDLPPTDLGAYAGVYLTSFYVEVNANQAAAGIEEKRLAASAYLRLFRNGVEPVSLRAPLQAAKVDTGSIISMAHPQAPSPDGVGWGVRPWERHYGLVLGKSVDAGGKTITLEVLDLYRFICGLWFPAITDLPYTEEGQGIPYLDAGGGRTCTRSTKAYVKVQEKDVLYVEVPLNKEKWSPHGLLIEGPLTAVVLNDSFSQGSGNVFTSWTKNESGGGTVTESTADYLFDVSNLRRSCVLTSGTTATAWASVYQAVTPGAGWMRAHFFTKTVYSSYTPFFLWRLHRSSDNWYWNDSTGAWQSTFLNNALPASYTAPAESWSKPFATSGGVTYTLEVYVVEGTTQGSPGNQVMQLYYASLLFSSALDGGVTFVPSPIVTTTTTVTTAVDLVRIANPLSARSLDMRAGTGMLRARIAWDHAWLADSGSLGHSFFGYGVDLNNRDLIYYSRTNATTGTFKFIRIVGGTSYTATITVTDTSGPGSANELPTYGDQLALAWRWQQDGGELGNANYRLDLWVTGMRGGTSVKTASAIAVAWTATANAPIEPGRNAPAGNSTLGGAIRDIEVVPFVLPEVEIFRRLGI